MSLWKGNEIIVLTGIPGSGKSTLTRERFPSYKRINLDTLKSRGKEDAQILLSLEAGENIIIDNTNTTRKSRRKYIDIAKAYKVPVRSIYLKIPLEFAIQRNSSRAGKEKVPRFAIARFFKILEPPSKDEGFDSLETIEVVGG